MPTDGQHLCSLKTANKTSNFSPLCLPKSTPPEARISISTNNQHKTYSNFTHLPSLAHLYLDPCAGPVRAALSSRPCGANKNINNKQCASPMADANLRAALFHSPTLSRTNKWTTNETNERTKMNRTLPMDHLI